MRYVYLFHEGNARMKELLGGKGANLAEMTNIGLPVPCGMTITTDACREYYNNGFLLYTSRPAWTPKTNASFRKPLKP